MHDLHVLIGDYMSFRAARGFQPKPKIEHLLIQFVGSLPAGRRDGLVFSNADAVAWANAPAGGTASWAANRLSVVRGFARFLAGAGLPVQVPTPRQLPSASLRAVPYLYSEAQIRAIMDAADVLFTPFRAATMQTLVGLLAVTGMRIGEALGLAVGDIDHEAGTVRVRNAKFGRERIIHIHPSTSRALRGYLASQTRRRLGAGDERPLFTTSRGTAVGYSEAGNAFHRMTIQAGILPRAGARPRAHDLRHTFATRSMIEAYRENRDPARTFIALSVWLGHSNPADTYWYLQASPEVAAIAARLLESGQEQS